MGVGGEKNISLPSYLHYLQISINWLIMDTSIARSIAFYISSNVSSYNIVKCRVLMPFVLHLLTLCRSNLLYGRNKYPFKVRSLGTPQGRP